MTKIVKRGDLCYILRYSRRPLQGSDAYIKDGQMVKGDTDSPIGEALRVRAIWLEMAFFASSHAPARLI